MPVERPARQGLLLMPRTQFTGVGSRHIASAVLSVALDYAQEIEAAFNRQVSQCRRGHGCEHIAQGSVGGTNFGTIGWIYFFCHNKRGWKVSLLDMQFPKAVLRELVRKLITVYDNPNLVEVDGEIPNALMLFKLKDLLNTVYEIPDVKTISGPSTDIVGDVVDEEAYLESSSSSCAVPFIVEDGDDEDDDADYYPPLDVHDSDASTITGSEYASTDSDEEVLTYSDGYEGGQSDDNSAEEDPIGLGSDSDDPIELSDDPIEISDDSSDESPNAPGSSHENPIELS